ncbi:MAG: BLUF domain-containing protein [Pseudomonadota bacterium]
MLDEYSRGHHKASPDRQKQSGGSDDLVALSYSSKPAQKFSRSDIRKLLHQARTNNARLDVTGVIVIGRSRIYQWLEGPASAIDEVMSLISKDPRHSDIKILDRKDISERLFGPWTMLLATDRQNRHTIPEDAVPVPRGVVTGNLNDLPVDEALLRDIALRAQAETQPPFEAISTDVAGLKPQAILDLQSDQFAESLKARLNSRLEAPNVDKWERAAAALTTLLLEDDYDAVEHFLRSMSDRTDDPLALQVSLLEQSERRLGDLWYNDLYTDYEINVALAEMIRALRAVNVKALPLWRAPGPSPHVLVISQPGEQHMLPAVLDAEVLWQQGWSPTLEFPKRDKDLQRMLSENWYGALDISLSGVFRRQERLTGVANTVEMAREASANNNIVITVGGRAIYEDRSLLIQLGADALVPSANEVETAIEDAMRRSGQ